MDPREDQYCIPHHLCVAPDGQLSACTGCPRIHGDVEINMPRASLEEALTAMKTFKYTIDLSRAAMDQYGVSADMIGDLQYSHNKARWEAKGAPPLPLTASISATPVEAEAEAEAEDEGDGHVLDSEGHDTVRRLGGKVLHLKDDEQTKKEAANKVGDT